MDWVMDGKWDKFWDVVVKFIRPDLEKVIGIFVSYFLRIKVAVIVLTVLVVLDFITGVVASVKRGGKVISGRIFDTVIKMYVYYGTILTFILVEMSLGIDFLSYIAVSFAILTEAKSILENYAVFMPEVLNLKKYLRGRDGEGDKKDNSSL